MCLDACVGLVCEGRPFFVAKALVGSSNVTTTCSIVRYLPRDVTSGFGTVFGNVW